MDPYIKDLVPKLSADKKVRNGQFRDIARVSPSQPAKLAQVFEYIFELARADLETAGDPDAEGLWQSIPTKTRDYFTYNLMHNLTRRREKDAACVPVIIGLVPGYGPRAGPYSQLGLYFGRRRDDDSGYIEDIGSTRDDTFGWATVRPLVTREFLEWSEDKECLIPSDSFEMLFQSWQAYERRRGWF